MTPEEERLAEKVPDSELRRLVLEGSSEPVSVIIEVALPRREIEFKGVQRGGIEVQVPTGFAGSAESAQSEAESARRTAEASALIESIVGAEPVHLRAARALVASVTGEQLERIVESPLTLKVEPNRRL